jgi:hypothetical protein
MIYDVIINKKLYVEEQNIILRKNFLLCKSCFWCASLLNDRRRSAYVCPSCMNSELESMPISFDETYKFDYNASHGVTLEFGAIK